MTRRRTTGAYDIVTSCPIALAFKKLFPKELVSVSSNARIRRFGKTIAEYDLSQRLKNVVDKFDAADKPPKFPVLGTATLDWSLQ